MSYNPLNYLTYKWEDVEDVGVLIVKIIKCIDLPEADTIIGRIALITLIILTTLITSGRLTAHRIRMGYIRR